MALLLRKGHLSPWPLQEGSLGPWGDGLSSPIKLEAEGLRAERRVLGLAAVPSALN